MHTVARSYGLINCEHRNLGENDMVDIEKLFNVQEKGESAVEVSFQLPRLFYSWISVNFAPHTTRPQVKLLDFLLHFTASAIICSQR